MLALRVIRGPAKSGKLLSIDANRSVVIGRGAEADLQLPSNGISKKHCQVREVSGGRLEIVDLGSSNGTYVNGLMVKKHLAKPGDTISLHDFVLKVEIQAPKVAASNVFQMGGMPASDFGGVATSGTAPGANTAAAPVNSQSFIERTIYPIADNIARQVDVRFLVLGFFLVWSVGISCLSIFPFADTANRRIEEQASEVAKLYARQLARINQSFIIEHTYQKLVHNLDQYSGQTPGVLNTMIVDASNGQILAPPDLVGRSIASPESVAGVELLKKIQSPSGYAKTDARGVIHALAPIRVGVTEADESGNPGVVSKVAAVAYVEMDSTRANLKAADLVDGALTAVLLAVGLGFLFVIMVYRWTEGTVVVLGNNLESMIGGQSQSVALDTQWESLRRVSEQINTIASRSGAINTSDDEKTLEWAMAAVESLPLAAAAFDENLVVVSWNARMENLIGIRASMALGADISAASRDIAFEGAIRELSSQAMGEPGVPQRKTLDFSGREHEIVLVYSEGAHLVNITASGEG